MNKVILIGRLTKDPDVRYGQDGNPSARYTLAVNRRSKNGNNDADFINCIAFGKGAEFAEKYLHRGTKICVTGHIQTGSYTNREGQKVYTTDVVIEEQEFAESKSAQGTQNDIQSNQGYRQPHGYSNAAPQSYSGAKPPTAPPQNEGQMHMAEGFCDIPDDVNDEGLPFN